MSVTFGVCILQYRVRSYLVVTSTGPFDTGTASLQNWTFFPNRFLCLANIFEPPVETVFILVFIYSNIHTYLYMNKCVYLYPSSHFSCSLLLYKVQGSFYRSVLQYNAVQICTMIPCCLYIYIYRYIYIQVFVLVLEGNF